MEAKMEWRTIPSWPRYQVSDNGNVRRFDGFPMKLRAHENRCDGKGHLYFYPKRGKKCYVHRAILEAFVGPCPADMECRHLDGDPQHNQRENLQWGTRQENSDDQTRHGHRRRGVQRPGHKFTELDVLLLRAIYPDISARQLGFMFGVSSTNTLKAIKGIKWGHI